MSLFNDLWLEPIIRYLDDMRDTPSAGRGRSYALEHRVTSIEAASEGWSILAQVQGSRRKPYKVEFSIDEEGGKTELDASCDCPVEPFCKHVYAVGVVLLAEAVRMGGTGRDEYARRYLPAPWRSGKRMVDPRLFPKLKHLFSPDGAAAGQPARPIPEKAVRQSARLPWHMQFLQADTPARKRESLRTHVAQRLPRIATSWMISGLVDRILGIENPIELLEAMEGMIDREARLYGVAPTPASAELLTFLASDRARELREEFGQMLGEQKLFSWLSSGPGLSMAAADPVRIEAVWTSEPTNLGVGLLHCQILATGKRLNRKPRNATALLNLGRELEGGQRSATPIETRFLVWLGRSKEVYDARYAGRYNRGDDTLIPVQNALLWWSQWAYENLIQWEDGSFVTVESSPARLSLQNDPGEPPRWAVEWPPPSPDEPGAVVPLHETKIIVDRDGFESAPRDPIRAYVRRGTSLWRLETGGMPLDVLAAVARMPVAPVERLIKSGAVHSLARRLTGGRRAPNSGGLVREVPVQPVLEFRAGGEGPLSLRFTARTVLGAGGTETTLPEPGGPEIPADGGTIIEFFLGGDGMWREKGAADTPTVAGADALGEITISQPGDAATPAIAADGSGAGEVALPAAPDTDPAQIAAAARALVRVPRMSDIMVVYEWLDKALPANSQTPPPAGTEAAPDFLYFNRQAAALIARHWPARPPRAQYLGDRAFQNLVTPRSRPRLNLKVETSGMNWLAVSVEWEDDLKSLKPGDILDALRSSEDALVMLPGGRLYRREDLEAVERDVQTLSDLGLEFGTSGQRLHATHLAGDAGRNLIDGADQEGGELRELAGAARRALEKFKGIPLARIPEPTAGFLRPYQRAGVDFLVWSAETFGGALLADEMGLGKTLQILAALSVFYAAEKERLPTLVLCPASVAHNWAREAQRFAPGLSVRVIERGSARREVMDRLHEFDLIVMNYALARRDASILAKVKWLCVVVDEAQAIKNPQADISKVVKQLGSKYRFALTGTPIENRVMDLWSILDFAVPGYLRPMPELARREGSEASSASLRVLRARLRPVLLRRLKEEVAPELPDRIEERVDCEMTTQQRAAYLAEVKKTRQMLAEMKGTDIKGTGRIQMLAALMRLRQICCDPELVGLKGKGSGKVTELMELIPQIIEGGHKILVFSQFVRMLNLLKARLMDDHIPFRMLTGQTTKRQELVDEFESDKTPGVFLISLKAGGAGLNLVSASHVIIFDPWWNPAVEAQAIDRTHRIGQDKTVIAFRLVTMGTIEERILELQERKRGLTKNILEDDAFNRTLSKTDFEFLLTGDEIV